MIARVGFNRGVLSEDDIESVIQEAVGQLSIDGKKVLVVIPDGTRTMPLPLFFRLLVKHLEPRSDALTFMVALGTHPVLSEQALLGLVGISPEQKARKYANVVLTSHAWDDPSALVTLGTIEAEVIAEISGGLLNEPMPVRVNRAVLEHDHVLICGPVFPHEVVGYSGGDKYFFPGVSGPELIDMTHWLGALITSYHTCGIKHTPVREAIRRAATLIPTPYHAFCAVVTPEARVAGLYFGESHTAWSAAADLSAEWHIKWLERPYQTVFSAVSTHYHDLWTGAKGMYKVEPVVADGGEVIIYAPHITEVSYTHGALLDEVGYHVRDYFLQNWGSYKGYPRAVLAHSTHLRGLGTYENGVEEPRIRVTLATGIPRERCEKINLGYLDPHSLNPAEWQSREEEGILFVPQAGETLYRVGRKAQIDG